MAGNKPPISIPPEYFLENTVPAMIAVQRLCEEIEELLPTAEAASDIAGLFVRLEHAHRIIETIQKKLNRIEEHTRTVRLPEIFESQQATTTTVLGYRVTTSAQLRASIREGQRDKAHSWITSAGHGDIIKIEPTVHPSTLQGWARQMVEDGEDLPEDLFSTYIFNNTSVTKANKK